MANEQMSQDEIDSLLKDITKGEVDVAGIKASTSEFNIEIHRVNTAVERLYFAYENGMPAEEIKYRQWFLHNEAHTLWLKRHRYTRQEWQEKVIKHFILHPKHYQLLMLKKMQIYKEG